MIQYVTGDLLKSEASCLVNTVNCEGYMGKGIAYQFKLQFPRNNAAYIRACKSGALKPGILHTFQEQGKTIVNFPTKDKWRQKSKMEYITDGLDALVGFIRREKVDSIAIPPLGSGNGGLIWTDVKQLIQEKLTPVSADTEIYIYEPSHSYAAKPIAEPKLSASALVLMDIKGLLKKFGKLRLQKTAYFMDILSCKEYFRFARDKYGPFDYSIEIISKGIQEFQSFHKTSDTKEARQILYQKIVSDSVNATLEELAVPMRAACAFVNTIESDHELECLSTVCYLLQEKSGMTEPELIVAFKQWSPDKARRFSENEISAAINILCKAGIIEKNLVGYALLPRSA